MIDELIKQLQELRKYEYKYKCAQKDKQTLSDLLFDYMMNEYKNMSYEERCRKFCSEGCADCVNYLGGCELKECLPANVWEPIRSDKGWIPERVICSHFECW